LGIIVINQPQFYNGNPSRNEWEILTFDGNIMCNLISNRNIICINLKFFIVRLIQRIVTRKKPTFWGCFAGKYLLVLSREWMGMGEWDDY